MCGVLWQTSTASKYLLELFRLVIAGIDTDTLTKTIPFKKSINLYNLKYIYFKVVGGFLSRFPFSSYPFKDKSATRKVNAKFKQKAKKDQGHPREVVAAINYIIWFLGELFGNPGREI